MNSDPGTEEEQDTRQPPGGPAGQYRDAVSVSQRVQIPERKQANLRLGWVKVSPGRGRGAMISVIRLLAVTKAEAPGVCGAGLPVRVRWVAESGPGVEERGGRLAPEPVADGRTSDTSPAYPRQRRETLMRVYNRTGRLNRDGRGANDSVEGELTPIRPRRGPRGKKKRGRFDRCIEVASSAHVPFRFRPFAGFSSTDGPDGGDSASTTLRGRPGHRGGARPGQVSDRSTNTKTGIDDLSQPLG